MLESVERLLAVKLTIMFQRLIVIHGIVVVIPTCEDGSRAERLGRVTDGNSMFWHSDGCELRL